MWCLNQFEKSTFKNWMAQKGFTFAQTDPYITSRVSSTLAEIHI